ncbi:MAG: hypothetical protein K0U98_26475 [Deltaproteobacteria bacterium]|nr:hypothetical protein [Deltaproteobacteria bacterium]
MLMSLCNSKTTCLLSLLLATLLLAQQTEAATFTVNQTGDSGAGSFRQAILDSNAAAGLDTIAFNIPGAGPRIILPTSGLPAFFQPVIVDGTTQPGFAGVPLIVIDGSSAGVGINGLRFIGGSSTLRSVVVNNWDRNGIRFDTVGGNTLEGCYVGTNPTGTGPASNGINGVVISNVADNLIGGTTVAARNVISGNTASGLRITGNASSNNRVEGNYFGINAAGNAVLANGLPAGSSNILIDDAPNNIVGGPTASHRNIISGSTLGHGMSILNAGSVGNRVQNNYIGTNAAGNASLPSVDGGLVISNSASDTVVEDNVISGNLADGGGVKIEFSATNTLVRRNLIGVDATGTFAIPNFRGVLIQTASGNTVGGSDPADRNIISGNQTNGVAIQNNGSTNNLVEGNWIGTDITGTAAIGNGNNGVQILDVPGNTIRGNVIAGSTFNGVQILNAPGSGNRILSNFIGTNAAGTAPLPNLTNGVSLSSAPNNIIGLPNQGNVISGNGPGEGGNGVRIDGAGADGNSIQGNFIGTRADGVTPMENGSRGIFISNGANNSTIGGLAAGEGNIIALNARDGIGIQTGTGHLVSGNRIFDNGGVGIDVWPIGIANNDAGDPDGGVNLGQNHPVVDSAITNGVTTMVEGSLNSTANTSFQVEFFSVPDCDVSGRGEGRVFLGATSVNTNGSGDATYSIPVDATTALHWVSATASDPQGNTSEFSPCRQIQTGGCANCIFSDGFESGNTSEWPTSVGE